MEKTILIDGKEVLFKATAATPIHYRNAFGRDMMRDMQLLADGLNSEKFAITTLEVFEKVGYIMARSGANNAPDFPKSPEEWLDQFSMFSIYEILPQLVDLWGLNTMTLNKSKKIKAVDRPTSTALFLLRCVQIGLSLRDLDLLSMGAVFDMFTESSMMILNTTQLPLKTILIISRRS